jgi:dynein heavy chain
MIDPQTQANKFIKNMGRSEGDCLSCYKLSDKALIKNLEIAIPLGRWVLIENIGEYIDPSLEPILLKNLQKQGTSYYLKLGDKSVQWNEDFKLFMTTTLPNPHYSPETSVKVSILNFAITPSGLEEQMLNNFVQLEMPDLQEKKNQIVEENARSAKVLYDIETSILEALDTDQILDLLKTDDLINILDDSAKTQTEISERQVISSETEKEIDKTRAQFVPVAFRASLLFFCIVDLNLIDPMYQYSLQWFQRLFASAVNNSEQSEDADSRVQILNNFFTLSLYQNVCRSLFEANKLIFSTLLCVKILFGNNELDPAEWRFFLAGAAGTIDEVPNPTEWLGDVEWIQTYRQLFVMDRDLPAFKGITEYFREYNKKFKKIFDSLEAHEEPIPGDWNTSLNSFEKIILLKVIRPDAVTKAIQNFIIEKIGQKYVEPPTFRLDACFGDSANVTPLVFVLSSGSDPIAFFNKYAKEIGMDTRCQTISLGSG